MSLGLSKSESPTVRNEALNDSLAPATLALKVGPLSPEELKRERTPAALLSSDATINAIRSYLAEPTYANWKTAFDLKNALVIQKGFVWKPSSSIREALEYKVSLLFDDQKYPGGHGTSLVGRLGDKYNGTVLGPAPGERGQSANVDQLRDTIRAFDKGQAAPEQLRKALANAVDAHERRFQFNKDGWTDALIKNFTSFRDQAERRLGGIKVEQPSRQDDSRGLGLVGARFQQQVTFEKQFEGVGILTPRTPPPGQPFDLGRVSEVRAEPTRFFASGVANRDFLSAKPLNETERQELYQLRDIVTKERAALSNPLADPKAALEAKLNMGKHLERFYNLFPRARMQQDAPRNGEVNRVLSDPKNSGKPEVIFVNGINTDHARSSLLAASLSNQLQIPIRHVVNVNDAVPAKAAGLNIIAGSLNDLEAANRTIGRETLSNPAAAAATANVIYEKMMSKGSDPITIVGYSQGGAITARALEYVANQLSVDVKKGKITEQERQQQIDRVHVVGFASAAAHRDFPAEFRNNIQIIYDRNDDVPKGRAYTSTTNYQDSAAVIAATKSSEAGTSNVVHSSYFDTAPYSRPTDYNPTAMDKFRETVNQINAGNSIRPLIEIDARDSSYVKYDSPAK
jgi:hypothetical protein